MAATVFSSPDQASRVGDSPADQPADQRMRARRGYAVEPGDDVPGDCADERREHDLRRHDVGADDAPADGLGDVETEEHEGYKIEEGSPEDRILRAQHTRRDDGGDGVRSVMQAVQEIEEQSDADQADEKRKGESGVHPLKRSRSRCR